MSRHSGWQVPNIFPGIRSLSAPRRGRGGMCTVQEIQVFIQVPITTSVQLAIASIQVDFVATEKSKIIMSVGLQSFKLKKSGIQ